MFCLPLVLNLFKIKNNKRDKRERIIVYYQHACLKYVSNEKIINQTLRERFRIEERNASMVSRIIRETIEE